MYFLFLPCLVLKSMSSCCGSARFCAKGVFFFYLLKDALLPTVNDRSPASSHEAPHTPALQSFPPTHNTYSYNSLPAPPFVWEAGDSSHGLLAYCLGQTLLGGRRLVPRSLLSGPRWVPASTDTNSRVLSVRTHRPRSDSHVKDGKKWCHLSPRTMLEHRCIDCCWYLIVGVNFPSCECDVLWCVCVCVALIAFFCPFVRNIMGKETPNNIWSILPDICHCKFGGISSRWPAGGAKVTIGLKLLPPRW